MVTKFARLLLLVALLSSSATSLVAQEATSASSNSQTSKHGVTYISTRSHHTHHRAPWEYPKTDARRFGSH